MARVEVDLPLKHKGIFFAGVLNQIAEFLEAARMEFHDDGNEAFIQKIPGRIHIGVILGLNGLALASAGDAASTATTLLYIRTVAATE